MIEISPINHDDSSQLQKQKLHLNLENISNQVLTEQSTEIFLNKTITAEDIKEAPKLTVKEIEGTQIQGRILEINAGGVVNGARKRKDGATLFGPQLTDENNNIINDIAIDISIKEQNHLFVIYYKKETNKYYIRTYKEQLTNGLSVLLVKIQNNFFIYKREIFMIGDLFFLFQNERIGNTNQQLTITKLSCKRSPEENRYVFNSFEFDKGDKEEITIGRNKKATISFHTDKAFSKTHCTITFNKIEEKWELKDGDGKKKSTNGVWVIPKHSMEIYDGMLFKIMGCSKFQININN